VPFVDEESVVILGTVVGLEEVSLISPSEIECFVPAPRGTVHNNDGTAFMRLPLAATVRNLW
jgi:hypothetical protein